MSALLEHWLGWDDKHHHNHHHAHHSRAQSITNNNNNYSEEMADRLVSHLIEASSSSHLPTDAKANSQDPKLWVRKFCSEVGCDVLKKQDANGKTLLHHLLSGKSLILTRATLIAVKTCFFFKLFNWFLN